MTSTDFRPYHKDGHSDAAAASRAYAAEMTGRCASTRALIRVALQAYGLGTGIMPQVPAKAPTIHDPQTQS